jgi:hypothetical protein
MRLNASTLGLHAACTQQPHLERQQAIVDLRAFQPRLPVVVGGVGAELYRYKLHLNANDENKEITFQY